MHFSHKGNARDPHLCARRDRHITDDAVTTEIDLALWKPAAQPEYYPIHQLRVFAHTFTRSHNAAGTSPLIQSKSPARSQAKLRPIV